ncbi:MAG: S8 family peptidase [Chloroflexi bacterium]|nr:S8 family peptidase [Chloroflexota bacterium]
MAEQESVSRPIQVFLDTGQFISLRESRPGGGNRDFFGGDNLGFSRHKSAMRQRIRDASATLRRDDQAAGFVIVQMREAALAKSYRPLNALFSRGNSFRLVGGGGIGEIFFQCTPDSLDSLDHRIETRAELEPRVVENEETGDFEPRPSAYRSELGGIEDIRLPAPADRIAFSAREAAEWLSRPDTLGAYLVELFRPDPTLDRAAVDSMIEDFRRRLVRLGGIVALPLFPAESRRSSRGHLAISIQLTRDVERSFISLPLGGPLSTHEELQRAALRSATQNVPVARHQDFLEQMAAEPMVRRITLPPSLEIAPLDRSEAAESADLPAPPKNGSPVVGIIDGGVASIPPLAPWRTGGTDPIDPADRDLAHGTFIAGLIAGARALNPHIEATLEPEGCRYFDIPLMPRSGLFPSYYIVPSDFFDQLEEEVIRAKSNAGVRVFNLSLGAPGLRRGLGYSIFARALDDIAAEHDVLFVVSAGNLRGPQARPPWPSDGNDAVRLLAGGTGADELITAPAEHLLGLSVGALNPPGIAGHDADLPTTYTRRGPGAGGARKPDLSHYGGVSPRGGNRTGLSSFASDNTVVDNNGTSFAAPLVASTVATIDHRLEGAIPRETLIALLVHRAQRCEAMQHAALRHVAREFVGFGTAPPADACLSDRPHSITLVFSEFLASRRELQFVFSWPRSLVTPAGKCRGKVDLTLAFTPPIDAQFDAECLRVQLEAYLHQIETDPDTGEDDPQSRLNHYDSELPAGRDYTETYLLKTGLKWTPVKRYHLAMPRGRGTSSNWRLALRSSTRAGDIFPASGVPFTIVMTISDLDGTAPVYDEVRNEINRRGLELADITLAHRVRPRS